MAVGVAVYPFLLFKFRSRFFFILKLSKHRKMHIVDASVAFKEDKCIGQYLKGDVRIGQLARHAFEARRYGSSPFGFCICNGPGNWFAKQTYITTLDSTFGPMGKCRKLVQIVSGVPEWWFLPSLEQTYFTIINKRKNYLFITNPYVTDIAIMQALHDCCWGVWYTIDGFWECDNK